MGARKLGGEACEHCSGTGFEPSRPAETIRSNAELREAAEDNHRHRRSKEPFNPGRWADIASAQS